MKHYKKYPAKILQIRLSEKEYDQVKQFINKFGTTHREWVLAVCNELADAKIIRQNQFYLNHQQFAYQHSEKWDKIITDESVCEKCGTDKSGTYQLERHHYLGYEGENAFKVQILCRECHGKERRKNYKNGGAKKT